MKRFLAYSLACLVLLQSLGREVLVLDYALNKTRITELYCVNKTRPLLHCNGKCYLAKKLRRAAEYESKAPGNGMAKVKFEALLPIRLLMPPMASAWPKATLAYTRLPGLAVALGPLTGVFHPPALWS